MWANIAIENIVFDGVKNASGKIAKIVKINHSSNPFKNFSSDFVKSTKDLDKLSIIKAMIANKSPSDLLNKFTDVIEFRNRLAHGNRFGKQSDLPFDEIAKTLDDVLNFI